MNHVLSSAANYLASLWRSEPATSTLSNPGDPFQVETRLAVRALNQQISDKLPGCTFGKATLRETKNGKLSFHAESGEIIIFSNEKTMNEYLAEKAKVDIWEIEDLRGEKSNVFYKLQRADAWGYDTFETKGKLFDQLREDYGVFWKLEDPESLQTTYIRYKTGLLGSYYDHVAHENLIYVADSLGFGAPNQATPATSDRASWGPGKTIAACLLGGLLISAGRSWESNQNSVSDAIAMMKGTLGPVAFKTAFVFQISMIAAVSRQQGGALPGALLAGMMLLPESAVGQTLCPQLVGSYNTSGEAIDVAIFDNYAYVADYTAGLQIIDVSTVTNPVRVGGYVTLGYARGVALSGNYAYIADWDSDLQIIDVSNVANPTLAGSYNTPGQAYGVALSGNYAYVADDSSLQIIDVSNVTNSTFAGFYDTPGMALNVAVSGNYAYVADYHFGLQIIDVSNKAAPVRVGEYVTPGYARGVVVFGNYAYVADDSSGLQIIDVSTITNPVRVGGYDTPGDARAVALSGNYAYVADLTSGLQIIDVSNVANPTLAGSYDTLGAARGVAVFGNYAYVADFTAGLQVIDVSIPCSTGSISSTSFSSTTTSSTTTSSTTSSSSSSTSSHNPTTTSSSSSSTSSRNPTTTTSSTTIPTDESSTSSSSSTRSTNPLGSTTNNLSSTLSLSEYSTLKSTMLGDSTTIGSDGSPLIWLGLLAGGFAGGALCICLIGGTVVILRRKFRNDESISATGSSDVEMPERQEENGEGETYTRLSDVVSAQNMKKNHSSDYVAGGRILYESKNPKPYGNIEEAARSWQD